jgi:hypothetical protein
MVLRISACEGIHAGQWDASSWQLLAGAVEAGCADGAAIVPESGSREAAMASIRRVETGTRISGQLSPAS